MAASEEFEATTVFTVPQIAAGKGRAGYVCRQTGTGLWYVLPSAEVPVSEAETMTTMRQLLIHDPSLAILAQMKAGLGARRESAAGRWQALSLALPERGKKNQSVLVGAGHDPALLKLERRRTAFANQASVWLIMPGTLLVLAAVFVLIGVQKAEPVFGMPAPYAYAGALLLFGLWQVACGFAVGSSERARWALIGVLAPLTLGGVPLLWGLGYLSHFGIEPPGLGPEFMGVPLLWVATKPAAIAVLAIALWLVICAIVLWWVGRKIPPHHAPPDIAAADEAGA